MKYIKTYEGYEFPQLDKYVLYKTNSDKVYFILEITGYEKTYIAAKKLYIYNIETNILRKGKHQYYNIAYKRIEDVIYKSNILKEVKDAIPALKEIGKYNI